MNWDEQRDLLFSKAAEDQKAMGLLAGDAGISDTTIGFHAQQAVEKYLKALLCHLRVSYERTHDLVLLLDALTDAGHPPPAEIERCKYLQPYAVRFRYDNVPATSAMPLDRQRLEREVEAIRRWVESAAARAHPTP